MARLTLTVELDANPGELRQPDLEIGFAVGIVGRPALAPGFAAIAGVDAATEGEPVAEGVLGRKKRRRAPAEPETTESAAKLGGCDARRDDDERRSQ